MRNLTVIFLLSMALSSHAPAAEFCAAQGRVTTGKQPLSHVVVSTKSGSKKVLTGKDGTYRLEGLSEGSHTLTFTILGYAPREIRVEISSGLNQVPEIQLDPETSEKMMVIGSLRESQAMAVSEQHYAANIKNIIASDQIGDFPDTNAAEATQHAPGVNIVRDQGEGRYVQVRGTEARLNKTAMNGAALPAPEGDLRTVALDVVPLNLLESIEITKSNTPDMDGDSVGGAVNLVTRAASVNRRLNVGLDYGYNELSENNLTKGELTFERRFMDSRLGFLGSFSLEDGDRATDNFEVAYDDGELEELEQRDYAINRKRIGAHTALDFRPNSNSHYHLNVSYSQFDDQEYRRRVRHRLDKDRMERELKDRFETQSILNIQQKGSFFFDNTATLKYALNYSYARESEPDRLDTTFRQKDVEFNPSPFDPNNIQTNPLNEDQNAYELDEMVRESNITNDRHYSARLSYEWPVSWSQAYAQMKVGARFRNKQKMRDNNAFVYEADDILLNQYLDSGYQNRTIFDDQYAMGAMPNAAAMRDLLASLGDSGEKDLEEDAGDYDIEEQTTALYAMATIDFNDRFMLLPGVRFEQIKADYEGKEVLFDDEGDWLQTVTTRGDKTDDFFMPMVHMRYEFNQQNQIRAALTRSYARARVYDQVPYRLILREDREIEAGNPDINITDVWNLDLSYESYFGNAGLFTIGAFYKDMNDIIFIFNSDEAFDGDIYDVKRPLNGDSASLMGVELAFQKNFTELPGPFDGLGVMLNYTWTDSKADFLDRRDFILPGQADEIGNLAVIYEKSGFSVRVTGNLHGEFLEEAASSQDEDIYIDQRMQWDMSASYRWKDVKFVLDITNLNDEAFVRYEGSPNRPIQFEKYKRWARFGVRFGF